MNKGACTLPSLGCMAPVGSAAQGINPISFSPFPSPSSSPSPSQPLPSLSLLSFPFCLPFSLPTSLSFPFSSPPSLTSIPLFFFPSLVKLNRFFHSLVKSVFQGVGKGTLSLTPCILHSQSYLPLAFFPSWFSVILELATLELGPLLFSLGWPLIWCNGTSYVAYPVWKALDTSCFFAHVKLCLKDVGFCPTGLCTAREIEKGRHGPSTHWI